MSGRGRPQQSENIRITKYEQTIHEFTNPEFKETGWKSVWYFDDKKSICGAYKVDHYFPKGKKTPKLKIEKRKPYNKNVPVVLIFRTSNRLNAKVKMKVFRNENIDYVLTAPKLVGVPDKSVILDCGVGDQFIEQYKLKYKL
jgi:ribosomal protein L39E